MAQKNVNLVQAEMVKSTTHPLMWMVLVNCDRIATKTQGGIHIPGSTRDLENAAQPTGIIIEVGPLAWHDALKKLPGMKVPKAGDRVFFGTYAGLVWDDPETENRFRLLNDTDILGFVDPIPKKEGA